MRAYFDDRNRRQLPPDETTVLKVSGPLRAMTGRGELHLDKPNALALAKWLGFTLARPDPERIRCPDLAEAETATAVKRRRKGA